MRKALVLFHVAGLLFAADPPYFTDAVEGWALPDQVTREKAAFTPGKLANCKLRSSSASYTSWDCQVQSANFQRGLNGKTLSYPLSEVSIMEYQYDPNKPSAISYYFSGPYSETLPDGSSLNTEGSLILERAGANPTKLRGRFNLKVLGTNGELRFLAEIK